MDAFTLHQFWTPCFWASWRLRILAFRQSIYATEEDGFGRKIVHRLPSEVVAAIEGYTKQVAFDIGKSGLKGRSGTLKETANQAVEACFARLEKHAQQV